MEVKVVAYPSFKIDVVVILPQLNKRKKHVETEGESIRHMVTWPLAGQSEQARTHEYKSSGPKQRVLRAIAISDENTLKPKFDVAWERCVFIGYGYRPQYSL